METNEVWKGIEGFEGKYMISNLGNCKSLDRIISCHKTKTRLSKGKHLKPELSKNGYLRFTLSDVKPKKFLAHRLVAKAFLDNPDNKKTVNHKNTNKTDNAVSNLEWVSYSENVIHALDNGLGSSRGEKNNKSKLTKNQVLLIKNDLRHVETKSLAKRFNVTKYCINRIKKNESWKHL